MRLRSQGAQNASDHGKRDGTDGTEFTFPHRTDGSTDDGRTVAEWTTFLPVISDIRGLARKHIKTVPHEALTSVFVDRAPPPLPTTSSHIHTKCTITTSRMKLTTTFVYTLLFSTASAIPVTQKSAGLKVALTKRTSFSTSVGVDSDALRSHLRNANA